MWEVNCLYIFEEVVKKSKASNSQAIRYAKISQHPEFTWNFENVLSEKH